MKRSRTLGLGLVALMSALASPALGDVIYDVGSGQTYSTIQDAINATPFTFDGGNTSGTVTDPFTENHIIRVHEGTYTPFNTDMFSKLNNKDSRTSADARLVIEAVPGDLVTIQAANGQHTAIRESYVTLQGLRFEGMTSGRYVRLNPSGGTGEGRGGLLVYNNEFVGAEAMEVNNVNNEAPEFTVAFVQNFVHDLAAGNPIVRNNNLVLSDTEKMMVGGNVVYGITSSGGLLTNVYTPDGADSRYVINNTYISGPNTATNFFLQVVGQDQSSLTIANNLVVQRDTSGNFDIGYSLNSSGAGFTIESFPTLTANLQYDSGYGSDRWARVTDDPDGAGPGGLQTMSSDTLLSLSAFQEALAWRGVTTEIGSIDGLDPLFIDMLSNDYRIGKSSPAWDAGDPSTWWLAVDDLGIRSLLSSYFNPVLDPGYDTLHLNIGALTVPEPASALLLLAGAAVMLRRRRVAAR